MTVFEYHDAGTTEARQKAALAYLLAQSSPGKAATGVLSGLAVSQTTTASAGVSVASGAGVAQAAVIDGASVLVNDTATTIDVLTANPVAAVPRNDLVVLDSATNSLRVIIGAPNATPADPTVSAGAIPLARLRHAANATTISNSRIDDLRTFTRLATSPIIQYGTATLAGNATDQRKATVTFSPAFPATPRVMLQGLTGQVSPSTSWNVWPESMTSTGFVLAGVRNNTTDMVVQWVAILP